MWSRRVLVACAVLCLAAYVWVYASGLADAVIRSDGFSYYVYLPSWFLHGDATLAELARDCCGGAYPEDSGVYRWPGTRRWVNVHPIGVAILQAPFFPLAHALTRWSNLSADGFSLYYQHAVGLAGTAWSIAGLALLRRLLLSCFGDAIVAVTLASTLLATNLLHYATFDVSYSHVYSFFLITALLHLTAKWHRAPSTRTSVLLGLVAGLIVLTRHSNAIFLLIFPLYGATSVGSAREVFLRLRENARLLALIAGVAILVIAPQLAIYYQATGRPLVSPYGGLTFHWGSPRVTDVLFGVTKGLFFWSPLLLLSLAGFVRLWRSRHPARAFVVPAVLCLATHTYLIAAWWDWQLGASYGSRGFVDTLGLFAVGLAGFADRFWSATRTRVVLCTMFGAAAALSVFQMLQYWYGILPFNDTTWDVYREIFLKWR